MSLRESIVERHYAAIAKRDFSQATAMMSPEVVTILPGAPPMKGVEEFLQGARVFTDAFPDNHMELASCIEQGNLVVAEGKYVGTHTGPFATPNGVVPPTGKHLELPFSDYFQVDESGKVVSHRVYFDNMTLMAQLGLMPAGQTA